jgi:hypothetical protein
MTFHLLKIRSIQLTRLLRDLGLYVILIIAALFFFIYASYLYFQKSPECYFVAAALILIPLSFQSARNDIAFVHHHLDNPHFEVYAEYAVLVSPFALPALFTSQWYLVPVIYVVLLSVPFYAPQARSKITIKSFSCLIHPSDFEWISGVRRIFKSMLLLYMLAFILSWLRIAPLIFLWILTTMTSTFYEESESIQMLRAGNPGIRSLLHHKLFRHIRYLVILFLPVLVINTAFNPDYWLINMLFLLTQISLLYFNIVFKYAMYEPGVNLKSNSIITGIMSIGALVPFFLPVPVIMSVIYYFRSRKNLQNYLYD